MRFIPKLLKRNINVTQHSPLREFATLLTGVFIILIGIYIILGFSVSFIAKKVSNKTEQRIMSAMPSVWKAEKQKSSEEEYLQSIVDDFQSKCADLPYKLEVNLVGGGDNAYAFPGYRIIVLSGLLENAKTKNEIAFILAHEMGHFKNRDHLQNLGRSLVFLTLSAAVLGADNGVTRLLGKMLQATEMKFSQTQESDADFYALNMMNCLFGNISGSETFFKRRPEFEKDGLSEYFFSTHPVMKLRIEKMKRYSESNGYEEGEEIPLPKKY